MIIKKNIKTRWHRLFGRLLEELLKPTGITVITDFPIMSNPPESDILLIQNNQPDKTGWSKQQLAFLPDGIRDCKARNILIEFKYSESVNQKTLLQALGYDTFYKSAKAPHPDDVQTFIISSKTPNKRFLEQFEYVVEKTQGVYKSTNPMLEKLTLITLNDLENKSCNTFVKCFASRKKEKTAAFEKIQSDSLYSLSTSIQWFVIGLLKNLFNVGGKNMNTASELTPDRVMEMGKKWVESCYKNLSVKERLAGLKPEDILAGFKPEERLAGLKPEDIKKLKAILMK